MGVTNNNMPAIDRPTWEMLVGSPAASAAGTCITSDDERYIYVLISATSFWRYDTFADCWQQLANPTGGTVGTGTHIIFAKEIGAQQNGIVYGTIFALITSGTGAPVFNKYDIATNVWTNLSVTNLPGTFGTDGYLKLPEPKHNGYAGGYHSGVLNTITTSAAAAINATAITVTALPFALPNGAVLNFGTQAAPLWAVLTAAAAAAATSITVAPLVAAIGSGAVAYYYDHMYLIGNNATQMYRYSIINNTWSTTSANSGSPALGAVSGAPGAGCALKWLPGSGATNAADTLVCIRGGATNNVYLYNLATNTWTSLTYYPATETFSTGSHVATRETSGKNDKLLIQKDATLRIYELLPKLQRINPKAYQYLLPTSTAIVGDRMTVVRSPDGIEFLYFLLHTSASFIRTALFF